ncbi:MAG: lysophospholipid acyltransferase family protein [Nitrosomonas sp.]|nr:lysophospholipid acyltransferase family protein [Nitrosomonas sp.]
MKLCPGGVLPVCGRQGAVFVANHISWLDIMVILAVYPVHFVAKAEISTWPILGRLCRNAGTLFIEREKRGDTLRINRRISSILKDGRSVVIFPEGTTGDGDALQHFHASLLQPAVTAETLLYPGAIRYRNRDGSRNSSVAYVSVTIPQSLMQILAEPEIQVELIFRSPFRELAETGASWRIWQKKPLRRPCHSMLYARYLKHLPIFQPNGCKTALPDTACIQRDEVGCQM